MTGKTEFEGPGETVSILIEKKTTVTKDGFGAEPSIYPVTIVPARYNGTYEGGLGSAVWLCFPVYPHKLSEPLWRGWAEADRDGWLIGKGSSPDEAYADLIRLACKAAGADRADFYESPTWNHKDLKGRNE